MILGTNELGGFRAGVLKSRKLSRKSKHVLHMFRAQGHVKNGSGTRRKTITFQKMSTMTNNREYPCTVTRDTREMGAPRKGQEPRKCPLFFLVTHSTSSNVSRKRCYRYNTPPHILLYELDSAWSMVKTNWFQSGLDEVYRRVLGGDNDS